MWSDFLDEQWPLHLHDSFPALKYKDVLLLRNILDGFFVHGRDHAITHTHVFCPLFTWQVYKATFGDTQVYEMLSLKLVCSCKSRPDRFSSGIILGESISVAAAFPLRICY